MVHLLHRLYGVDARGRDRFEASIFKAKAKATKKVSKSSK